MLSGSGIIEQKRLSGTTLPGLTDHSQVDIQGVRYKSVNFGAEKSPGSNRQKERKRGRGRESERSREREHARKRARESARARERE